MMWPYDYAYPYIDPYPTTLLNETCPPPNAHPHHHLLPHWGQNFAKRFHDKDTLIHSPRADVIETTSAFHIDVELPGLSNKADITLKWLSSRTILVSCIIRRKVVLETGKEQTPPAISNGDNTSKTATTDGSKAETLTSLAGQPVAATNGDFPASERPAQHLTISERNIGQVSRAFNFPVDVEHKKTKGRLSAGLLTLVVLKMDHEKAEHLHEVDLEFEDELAPWFKD